MLSERALTAKGRIAYIDGLRAIAVLSVVVFHAVLHIPNSPAAIPFLSWRHLLFEGSHGVDLFFVLSGFCLSHPILRKIHASGGAEFNVYRYFAKRIVRIVPPFYLAIVVLSVAGFGTVPVGAIDLVKQSLFLDLHTTLLNASFWTLFIEFRWYFVFPIALALWVRAPRAFLALACAATLAYSLTIFHFVTDVATLLPFMLGIVAAHIDINGGRLIRWVGLALPLAVAFGFLFEFHTAVDALFFSQTNPGWQLVAFCCVVGCARPKLRRLLSWPPLVSIGIASYSIYLLHEPIIVLVESRGPLGPWLAPIAAIISIGAGFLFWLAWERMWTNGLLKDRAVRSVELACASAGKSLQIPKTFILASTHHSRAEQTSQSAPQAVPALAANAG